MPRPLYAPAALSSVARAVHNGLTHRPKSLPPFLFYDAAGSTLFEQITHLPEYYLTRTERQILLEHAHEIAQAAGEVAVVELGAGTAFKTGILLDALLQRQARLLYRPIDISRTALDEARLRLNNRPGLDVRPIVADFAAALPRLRAIAGRKLVLYIGSSIGNFDPPQARSLLRSVAANLQPGDLLLLGADMVKPAAILLAAYDDPQGVTAAFNKNILVRINRELAAGFDVDTFRHLAIWNERESRIEMHLESMIKQQVYIGALELALRFQKGESIHTENSHKFTSEAVTALLRDGGFTPLQRWSDQREWFTLSLARVD